MTRPTTTPDPSSPDADQRSWVTQQQLVVTALGRGLDRVVLADHETAWTGRELRSLVARMARALVRTGAGHRSRVALLGGNSGAFAAAQLASVVAGGSYSGLYLTAPPDELLASLTRLRADALVYDPATAGDAVAQLAAAASAGGCRLLSLGPHGAGRDLLALAADEPDELAPVPVSADDPASISWTGGTTGRPKGVVRSQRTMAMMTTLMTGEWDWPRPLRHVTAGPLSHAAGSMVTALLLKGATIHVRPRFDVDDFLATVERERCTSTFVVPTMIYRILDHPRFDDYDLSSLQLVLYGASPISPSRLDEGIRRLGPVFQQFYGQVEAPNCIAALKVQDHTPGDLTRLASCGRPLAGVQVALLAPDLTPVPTGEPGEVCVRGPLVMDGYLDDPEATSETLRGGWLHTGDIGVADADGFLTLVDRAKDMIVTGGLNVYPREVEDVLALHPSVAAASVIGIPDDEWGEAVVAYVVPAPGAAVDERALREHVKARKGPVHAPKHVFVVDALPLTSVGKPDKKALRARHWSGPRSVH